MVLLDALEYLDEARVQARTQLTGKLPARGRKDVHPAWGIEILAQACAAFIGYHHRKDGYTNGRLVKSRKITFVADRFSVDTRMDVHASLQLAGDNGLFLFDGQICARDQVLFSADLTIFAS